MTKPNTWYLVEDQMPDDDTAVLVVRGDHDYIMAYHANNKWISLGGQLTLRGVVAWMDPDWEENQ